MRAEGEVYVRELDPETSLWRLVIAQALQDGNDGRETDTSASLNRSPAKSIGSLRQPLDLSRIQHGMEC